MTSEQWAWRKAWKVQWEHGKELFCSPEGEWYVRAPAGWEAELEIPARGRGLPSLRLRKLDKAKWVRKQAKKETLRLLPRKRRVETDSAQVLKQLARLDWGKRGEHT